MIVIPTVWAMVPDDAQVLTAAGTTDVGPWRLGPSAQGLMRVLGGVLTAVDMNAVVPLLVPSEADAMHTLRSYFIVEEI